MFGRKDKANYDRPTTVIGKDTVIESGIVASQASVQVNGKVIADMRVDTSLVVGQKGLVEGDITASFILVAGRIVGNVEAINQIHLTKTAVVVGDIICQSIVIDDGARIEGNFSTREEMKAEEPTEA